EPAEWRQLRSAARFDLEGEKGVTVVGDERGDRPVLRHIGVDQAVTFDCLPSRTPGDLAQELEGALRRARVSLRQAEIGVDHADQSQAREMMALGDELRADDDIDLARLDLAQRL